MKPHLLVTNDDGIESAFLHRLVSALEQKFELSVAAPAFEQSWIGRAISRHKEIEVLSGASHFPETVQAWAINGTPTDCVNIAMGHLVKRPVDAVVSGINIGYNTTETLVLSSGTVAGAIEGAQWGLPAIAFSQCVPFSDFENIRDANGHIKNKAFEASQLAAAQHAAEITSDILKNPPSESEVINVNFPEITSPDTQIKKTVPAKLRLGSLYTPCGSGKFKFQFSMGELMEANPLSDRSVLEDGFISYGRLNFGRIGVL